MVKTNCIVSCLVVIFFIDWVLWLDDYVMNWPNMVLKLWILDWICPVNLCWNSINVLVIGSYWVGQHCDNFTVEYTYYFQICDKVSWILGCTLCELEILSMHFMGYGFLIRILCLTKCDYMSSCYVFLENSSCLDWGYYKTF